MRIGKPGSAVTRICQAYPDRVEVRGRDLCRDIVGRLSFTAYFHSSRSEYSPSSCPMRGGSS